MEATQVAIDWGMVNKLYFLYLVYNVLFLQLNETKYSYMQQHG